MKTVRYKMYFAWDFEKEEKWLNKMSEQGLQLVQPGFGRYVFEENPSVRYLYKLELLKEWSTHSHSRDYIRFLEETGVEHMGSVMRWAYFRKPAAEGNFELYSDFQSKIDHYKRILLIFLAVTPINVINLINMSVRYLDSGDASARIIIVILAILVSLLGLGSVKVYRQMSKLKKEMLIRE